MQIWRHVGAVLMLPGVVTIGVPALIIAQSHTIRVGWGLPRPWTLLPIAGGMLLIGAGLALMVQTIRLFSLRGHGTLAPWDPPQHLVVDGIYRRVRNPMISGVCTLLLGESLLCGSRPLLFWWVTVVGINLMYIPLLEEPALAQRFGARYRTYQQHVPRWLPRLYPWEPPWTTDG